MRACRNCKMLTEEENCPDCSIPTTQYWSGYFGVINPEKSEIAQKLQIKKQGQYALKVR